MWVGQSLWRRDKTSYSLGGGGGGGREKCFLEERSTVGGMENKEVGIRGSGEGWSYDSSRRQKEV